MKKGIIGRKLGMTQLFDEKGKVVPVTVISAGPCVVVQKRTNEKNGYEAVQLGFSDIPERKLNKPQKGVFAKAEVSFKKYLKEFRLENASYIMPLCIVVALWTSLGTSFLSFIAGLQGIDRSMYEAGAVDGIRNRWQELWYVTLPSMKPQLMFGAIMAITSSVGVGGVVDALAGNPSVDYCAWTIMHHLNDYLGARFEVGYGSAIAVVLFAIMIGANMLVKKILAKVGQ